MDQLKKILMIRYNNESRASPNKRSKDIEGEQNAQALMFMEDNLEALEKLIEDSDSDIIYFNE